MGNIVFEDKDIIVYFKEAGEESEGLAHAFTKPCFVVHRLDMPVSGLMVLAKNKKSSDILGKELQDNKIRKIYLAQVEGIIDEEGTLKDYLFHDRNKNKTFNVKTLRKGAKEAELDYSIVKRYEGSTLVRIKLKTGRTHQIRVQFASRKHPLLGDGKYGSRTKCSIRLCSSELEFIHPVTKEELHFECEPDWLEK
ncbi:MAG: RluA family pseudouridine synthase [Clostridia bacterium]|nr:RluA family pseudouridine synthase [Clostridia bacterium]